MNTVSDKLIMQTDTDGLHRAAERILQAFASSEAAEVDPAAEIYEAVKADVAAATAIFATADPSGQVLGGKEPVAADTAALIARIHNETSAFAQRIAPNVARDTPVDTYLVQIAAINTALLSGSAPLLSGETNTVDTFRQYRDVVNALKLPLGYVDFTASHDMQKYWPSAESYQGHYNFINLFRGSEPEREKSLRFMAFFDTLSPVAQSAAYAWIYDANFESYLSVAPVSDELPPWITSAALRALHASVNAAVMADFMQQEMEMLE